jgi:transmembrane sensor
MTDETPQTQALAGALAVKALAAEWRDRQDREDWSKADQAELDAWLAQSSAHMVAYLRVDAAWRRADRLTALHRGPMRVAPPAPRRNKIIPGLLRIVAAALIFSAVGLAASSYFRPAPAGRLYATAIGERETIRLPDGSQIELNTDTALRTDFSGGLRTIALEKGEAFFNIVHNPANPLIVQVGAQRIRDLGTQFSVARLGRHIEVKLVEGRAQFEGKGAAKPVLLTPGDVLVKRGASLRVTRKDARELANELSWRRGVLTFLHAPLSRVAHELNRYNRRKIVIADADIARLTIDGSFPATRVSAFTNTARDIFGLHVTRRGNEIVISH